MNLPGLCLHQMMSSSIYWELLNLKTCDLGAAKPVIWELLNLKTCDLGAAEPENM